MLTIRLPISHTAFHVPRRRFSLSSLTLFASTTLFRLQSSSLKMSIDMMFHAFAGSNIKSKTPNSKHRTPTSVLESLKHCLQSIQPIDDDSDVKGKILLFRNGRPLVGCRSKSEEDEENVMWGLEWLTLVDCREMLDVAGYTVEVGERAFVYLGVNGENFMLWGVDLSSNSEQDDVGLKKELARRSLCFVELRTLMVATDWTDVSVMQQLAIAGQGRALLEGSLVSQFCGYCGAKTVPVEAGRKKQCSNESCKKRIYPRVDTVMICLYAYIQPACLLL